MFSKVEYRFALRCVLVGVAAALSSVAAGGDWRAILISGVGAALAYAGVGAAVPVVEPQIGKKLTP